MFEKRKENKCTLRCLKSILSFFVFIYIFIGILLTGYGFSLMIIDANTIMTYQEIFYYTMLIIGIILIITGIIGLYGTCKKNKCLLGIYNFTLIPWTFIFLCLALMISIGGQTLLNDMQDDLKQLQKKPCEFNEPNCGCGIKHDYINFINSANNNIYTINNTIFGKYGECQVKASNQDIQVYLLKHGMNNVAKKQGVTTALDCEQVQENNQYNKTGFFMRYFENQFECSGLCSKTPFYTFSDVNNGIPLDNCYQKVYEWFDTNQTIIVIIVWIVFVFFLCTMIFACLLCFHPKQKQLIPVGENGKRPFKFVERLDYSDIQNDHLEQQENQYQQPLFYYE